jgi:hypothetical protein
MEENGRGELLALDAIVREHPDLNRLEVRMDEASDKTERAALGINVAMIFVDERLQAHAKSRCSSKESRFD